MWRSSFSDVFLGKSILKKCSKFTGKHPCQSVVSIKLLCNFIEVAPRHGCSPVSLLHIFRTPFYLPLEGWEPKVAVTLKRYWICKWRRNFSTWFFKWNLLRKTTHIKVAGRILTSVHNQTQTNAWVLFP